MLLFKLFRVWRFFAFRAPLKLQTAAADRCPGSSTRTPLSSCSSQLSRRRLQLHPHPPKSKVPPRTATGYSCADLYRKERDLPLRNVYRPAPVGVAKDILGFLRPRGPTAHARGAAARARPQRATLSPVGPAPGPRAPPPIFLVSLTHRGCYRLPSPRCNAHAPTRG